jgi:RimJ/RimL family protein N-acetyltransferase
VLALERHKDNTPYIGHWTREQHRAAIAASDREHWLIARAHDGSPLGFLLAFDLRARGFGMFVKRIAVADKSRGLGREALGRFLRRAFGELGASHVWLSVRKGNARAERVYRALGFEVAALTREERSARAAVAGGFGDDSTLMRVDRAQAAQ